MKYKVGDILAIGKHPYNIYYRIEGCSDSYSYRVKRYFEKELDYMIYQVEYLDQLNVSKLPKCSFWDSFFE